MSTTLGPMVPPLTGSSSCLLSMVMVVETAFMVVAFLERRARSSRSDPLRPTAEFDRHQAPAPGPGHMAAWLSYCCSAFKRAERRGGVLRARLPAPGRAGAR